MTELNKNSFYFYLLKEGRGKIDPRNIDFMIDTLKEWLPDEVGCPETGYAYDAYLYGQGEYKHYLMRNLK